MGSGVSSGVQNPPNAESPSLWLKELKKIDNVSIENRKKEEMKKKFRLKLLEQFVFQVYVNFPCEQCLMTMLSSYRARKAFERYLVNSGDNEYLRLYNDIDVVVNTTTFDSCLTEFEKLFSLYIFPRTILSELKNGKGTSFISLSVKELVFLALKGFDDQGDRILIACEHLKRDCIRVLSKHYFADFLASKEYTIWRSFEAHHAIAYSGDSKNEIVPTQLLNLSKEPLNMTDTSIIATERSSYPVTPYKLPSSSVLWRSDSRSGSYHASVHESNQFNFNVLNLDKNEYQIADINRIPSSSSRSLSDSRESIDMAQQAFASIDSKELKYIFNGENWLAALLAASECLPIGLSLSSAPIESSSAAPRSESTILFVNESFARIYGLERASVLKKSTSKLFFGSISSEEVNENMFAAIALGQTFTGITKNALSTGVVCERVISLRPLFEKKKYLYMIGIHTDITHHSLIDKRAKTRLSECLLSVIPDEVFSDVELRSP